jgi:predicted DNA-binding transcriptional regulator AlpA
MGRAGAGTCFLVSQRVHYCFPRHTPFTEAARTFGPAHDYTEAKMSALMTTAQAVSYLGISRPTFWRLHKAGKAPPRIQITRRRVGYLLADLDEWLLARRVGTFIGATADQIGPSPDLLPAPRAAAPRCAKEAPPPVLRQGGDR